jgi:two-component system chemotaxis response regulator CheY
MTPSGIRPPLLQRSMAAVGTRVNLAFRARAAAKPPQSGKNFVTACRVTMAAVRYAGAAWSAAIAIGWTDVMALNPSMPILVVDDYQTMIRIIRNLLKQLGFEDVDDAPDGATALGKLRQKKYGLVISDWNMEPMTGYDLLRQVRNEEEMRDTPFIMVTAESKTENVIAAKKAGVNNYIVKPFNAQTLRSKIEAACG